MLGIDSGITEKSRSKNYVFWGDLIVLIFVAYVRGWNPKSVALDLATVHGGLWHSGPLDTKNFYCPFFCIISNRHEVLQFQVTHCTFCMNRFEFCVETLASGPFELWGPWSSALWARAVICPCQLVMDLVGRTSAYWDYWVSGIAVTTGAAHPSNCQAPL